MRLFYKSDNLADSDTVVDMRKVGRQSTPNLPSFLPVEKKGIEVNQPDSVVKMFQDTGDEPIIVKRDELLGSYDLKIQLVSESYADKQDSLIQRLQGGIPNEWFRLDLFRSPLNFSGYKMTGSKIVIYGLDPGLKFKLYKYRSVYYLKADQKIFKLVETYDYNPLESDDDPVLKNMLML